MASHPSIQETQPAQQSKWTEEKNSRRCELVDKKIYGAISDDERAELEKLQAELLAHRQKIAPLPLAELRAWHQELLREAETEAGEA